jgi:hypothetical protein
VDDLCHSRSIPFKPDSSPVPQVVAESGSDNPATPGVGVVTVAGGCGLNVSAGTPIITTGEPSGTVVFRRKNTIRAGSKISDEVDVDESQMTKCEEGR